MATSSFDKTIVITKQAAEAIAAHLDKPSVTDSKQVTTTPCKLATKAMLAKRTKLR